MQREPGQRLERQGVRVEVIAEITSDLNRGLTKLRLIAPDDQRRSAASW
jgi:hypothetical protein